jgi:hypothetical protein
MCARLVPLFVFNVFQLSGELDAAQISVKDLEQKVSLLEHSYMANRDTLLCGVQWSTGMTGKGNDRSQEPDRIHYSKA